MAKNTTRAEELAKKAAKAKAKEAQEALHRTSLLEFGDDSTEEEELLGSESFATAETAFQLKQVEKQVAFDVFKDVGEPRFKTGDIVEYTIRKNNSHIATLNHPFSWELLHTQFGDGTYQVQARSGLSKQYIKSETRTIGNPTSLFNSFAKNQEDHAPKEHTPPPPQAPSFMEVFTLLMNQQALAKNEAKELSSSAATSNNQMIMMVMEMMKSNQAQAAQIQLQTMQMMTQVTEKLSAAQQAMFEKLNDRIEKSLESKKGDDSWEKMQKAQMQGFEMYQKFDELSTKKAELQLEMMSNDDEEKEEKKEPLIDSLIRTALPMIAGAQAQAQMPQSFVERPQHRGQLPQGRRKPVSAPQATQRRSGTSAGSNAASNDKAQGANVGQNQKPVAASGSGSRQNVVRKMNGLPTVDVTKVEVPDEVVETENLQTTHESVEVLAADVTLREKCQELLPSFIGSLMLEAVPAEEAAGKTVEFLAGHGIGLSDFLINITAQDLQDVAKTYSLPEEAFSWLNELYANLQTIAGTNAGREFTADDSHAVATGL